MTMNTKPKVYESIFVLEEPLNTRRNNPRNKFMKQNTMILFVTPINGIKMNPAAREPKMVPKVLAE